MPAPVTRRDVQVFLGMMGYYRRFIPNFATQAEPLFALLRKDIEFLWTDKCNSALNSLKSLLTKVFRSHVP